MVEFKTNTTASSMIWLGDIIVLLVQSNFSSIPENGTMLHVIQFVIYIIWKMSVIIIPYDVDVFK